MDDEVVVDDGVVDSGWVSWGGGSEVELGLEV